MFAVGIQIFLLAAGISLVRHGALPRWLGWIAIVLAIVAATPLGFLSFIGSGLPVGVISVMLALSERASGAVAG